MSEAAGADVAPVPADELELIEPVDVVDWAAAAPATRTATATPVTRIFAFISDLLPRLFERDFRATG